MNLSPQVEDWGLSFSRIPFPFSTSKPWEENFREGREGQASLLLLAGLGRGQGQSLPLAGLGGGRGPGQVTAGPEAPPRGMWATSGKGPAGRELCEKGAVLCLVLFVD